MMDFGDIRHVAGVGFRDTCVAKSDTCVAKSDTWLAWYLLFARARAYARTCARSYLEGTVLLIYHFIVTRDLYYPDNHLS